MRDKVPVTGHSPRGGGGDSHMKVTGMLVVSLRVVKLQILVSLRVFRKESQYFYPFRYRLGCA